MLINLAVTPTSGTISLADINTENVRVGNPTHYDLGSYRGLAWWDPSNNMGYFSTAPIDINQFYNKILYYVVNLDSNVQNYNLYSAVGSPPTVKNVLCIIGSGVEVTASDNSTYAFDVGSFVSGSRIYIQNKGYIIGRGGQGLGKSSSFYYGSPIPSYANGGPAFRSSIPVFVDNTNGIIGGGGGGGGAGGATGGDCSCSSCGGGLAFGGQMGAGGGGAGYGAAGYGARNYQANSSFWSFSSSSAGALTTGGGPVNYGGYGGGLGAVGITGSGNYNVCRSDGRYNYITVPTSGGTPGSAIVGNSNITWINQGNIYGATL
jgi:hypothetical protein